MDYELSKKLKDAGFPQEYKKELSDYAYREGDIELQMLHEDNDTGWWLGNDYTEHDMSYEEMLKSWIKVPNLSELIEAIEKGCDIKDKLILSGGHGVWEAWFGNSEKQEGVNGYSPEEAVANLWIELNKNK